MSTPIPTQNAVRCYTEVPGSQPIGSKSKRKRPTHPSEHALIFDCETTIDAAQALRVGFFQTRKEGILDREGICFDAETLSESDIAVILAYAKSNCLEALSIKGFSKSLDKHAAMVNLFFLHYNFCRIHKTLGVTSGGRLEPMCF